MIVVDASLATKWMLREDDSPQALDFLLCNAGLLCGPDTLFVEVAGVIVRFANQNKAFASDALRTLGKWSIAWDEHAVKPHRVTQRRLHESGRLAITLGHPLKDCVYLALAIEFGCDLATCDAKFRTRAIMVYPAIRLLSDYT